MKMMNKVCALVLSVAWLLLLLPMAVSLWRKWSSLS